MVSGGERLSPRRLRLLLPAFRLAQGLAAEVDAVGGVDDAVEDGVGDGRIPEHGGLPPFLIGWLSTASRLRPPTTLFTVKLFP